MGRRPSWLVALAFVLFTPLSSLLGMNMIRMPRPRAVPAKAFPAVFEMRVLGPTVLSAAEFCVSLPITLDGRRDSVANSGWNWRQEGRPE